MSVGPRTPLHIHSLMVRLKELTVDALDHSQHDGERNGRDTVKYANGDVYDGFWRDGKMQNDGRMKFANNDEYNGTWSNGKMNIGKYIHAGSDWNFKGEFEGGTANEDFPLSGTLTEREDGDTYMQTYSNTWDRNDIKTTKPNTSDKSKVQKRYLDLEGKNLAPTQPMTPQVDASEKSSQKKDAEKKKNKDEGRRQNTFWKEDPRRHNPYDGGSWLD